MTASYVDTNVLVYAFGDRSHPRRRAARILLEQAGDEGPLVTSTLTIDEFLWARRRESGLQASIQDAKALMGMPALQFLGVEPKHARKAIDHVETYGLRPRDAIHLAVFQETRCQRLLSDDPDFDDVPGIDRSAP